MVRVECRSVVVWLRQLYLASMLMLWSNNSNVNYFGAVPGRFLVGCSHRSSFVALCCSITWKDKDIARPAAEGHVILYPATSAVRQSRGQARLLTYSSLEHAIQFAGFGVALCATRNKLKDCSPSSELELM